MSELPALKSLRKEDCCESEVILAYCDMSQISRRRKEMNRTLLLKTHFGYRTWKNSVIAELRASSLRASLWCQQLLQRWLRTKVSMAFPSFRTCTPQHLLVICEVLYGRKTL